MTAMTELWVNRGDFRQTRRVDGECPQPAEGEILVAIDKFAMTANNVSYAASGDMIGYWRFFPTHEDPWGKVPVWGMADVVASRNPDIALGERLYGFFPMASHLVMTPGKIRADGFSDMQSHRQELPGLYNHYARTGAEPGALQAVENERCVYFPLFMTGYVIADLLSDNDWFGAKQIVIGSVSSKTGFGLASFLKVFGYPGQVVGLTSAGNTDFVESLAITDRVASYDELATIARQPSVFVDMAGDKAVRIQLHQHLEDNMKASLMVGATHWDAWRPDDMSAPLPGAAPEFFFAPAQIDKRNAEWGPGVLMEKAYAASIELALSLGGKLDLQFFTGPDSCAAQWVKLLNNEVSGKQGILISLQSEAQ